MPLGKKGAFYSPLEKLAVAGKVTPETPASGAGDSGLSEKHGRRLWGGNFGPGAGDSGPGRRLRQVSAKFPGALQRATPNSSKNPKNDFQAGDSGPRAGDSGLGKTAEIANTKTTISFASGLRFRYSWARWNHHNEIYNIMQ